MSYRIIIVGLFLLLPDARAASAQSFSADAHFVFAEWSEYYYPNKETQQHDPLHDLGAGAHLSWRPSAVFSIDGDASLFAQGPGDQNLPGRRFEGLVGATVGPQLGRFRPFAKVLLGFLQVARHRGAEDCVMSDPPYLMCLIQQGITLPAYDIGGGLEFNTSARGFLRADASARILKYPGPSYARDGALKPAPFWGSAPRLTFGYGVRF
jgi:hypothetical protein